MSNRESQGDFQTGSETYEGTSSDRRPDAVSFDYLTSFSLGPVARSDPSEGILDYAWRVRVDNAAGEVLIARENDAGDSWGPEDVLFSFTGDPIHEVDLSFNVNGDPVVVAERPTGSSGAPELWIQFYDSSTGQREFRNRGAGRNPRCMNDQPATPEFSSVIVAYISPSGASDAIAWREQGDRYTTEELTPITGVQNLYLEELGKNIEGRLQIAYAERDPSSATYELHELPSALYPYIAEAEGLGASAEPLSSDVVHTILNALIESQQDGSHDEVATTLEEALGADVEPLAATVSSTTLVIFADGAVGSVPGQDTGLRTSLEGVSGKVEPRSGTATTIVHVVYSEGQQGTLAGIEEGKALDEGLEAVAEPQSGLVREAVIIADNQPEEGVRASSEPRSGTVRAA